MRRRVRELVNRIDDSVNNHYDPDSLDSNSLALQIIKTGYGFRRWRISYSIQLDNNSRIRGFQPSGFLTYFGAWITAREVRNYYRQKGIETRIAEKAA